MGISVSNVLAIVFIGIGAHLVYVGAQNIVRAGGSNEWPNVPGVVVTSEVEHRRRTRSGSRGGSTITYYATVLYEYSVNGTLHRGDRVSYGDYGTNTPSHANEVVNTYPEGKNVFVFYMPGNPSESILEPGLTLSTWLRMGIGMAFLLFAALVLLVQRVKIKRMHP